jgi:WD40 repeat protein
LLSHDQPVRSVALSADGKYLASADSKGIVRIWDFKTGARLHSFEHSTGVNSVAFSPKGRYLLSGSDDKLVRLWDGDEDRQERRFEGHRATVGCVAFSADGRRAYSASYSPLGDSDHTIRLWDVATGKEVDKLEVGDEVHRMDCAAFSPDGRRALTGHLDGSVCLWDLATKKKLATFTRHKYKVQSVAFSPDGQLALSGENNQGGSEIWLYRLPVP